MELLFDIGKSYRTNYDAPDPSCIVKIAGTIDSDTVEYQKGFRYFCTTGRMGEFFSYPLQCVGDIMKMEEYRSTTHL